MQKELGSVDEHIFRWSECGRNLVKDKVNDGVAFLSHLKIAMELDIM